jgi:hypothetical protein
MKIHPKLSQDLATCFFHALLLFSQLRGRVGPPFLLGLKHSLPLPLAPLTVALAVTGRHHAVQVRARAGCPELAAHPVPARWRPPRGVQKIAVQKGAFFVLGAHLRP